MSKKYLKRPCVYCDKRLSTTADHVWGRGFFLVKHRDNLPKVPACAECNNRKSKLENYLEAVLPFGGRHREATATLATLVPRRLQKNQRLAEKLRKGYRGDKIPLEEGQIAELFGFVTKGLLSYHFGIVLNPGDRVAVTATRSGGYGLLDYIFSRMRCRERVNMNLGEGTLLYQGIQATDYAQFTLWRFSIYGGLQFCEQSKDPDNKHSIIFAMTGPSGPLSKLWQSIFREELPAA